MIHINEKDKFLKDIVEPIYKMESFRALKNAKDLYIYGVSREREYSIMLPPSFPMAKKLQTFFDKKDFFLKLGSLWDMSDTYNQQVLGLGYTLRKENPETCRKIILYCYLALNNQITFKG